MVDKTVPAHMFPLPPHYSTGRVAGINSLTIGNTTSSISTIYNDNMADNDTTSSRPKMGHIFTKDSGFGLNKLSYVGPIVMGFGGKYDFITSINFTITLTGPRLCYFYLVTHFNYRLFFNTISNTCNLQPVLNSSN